mmetsp:Transcript_147796/g.275466  ORF Transcript_147796/g.275466 Transcript_147796/m.275466 type:complete len:202 (-) Transcript_147796:835-1440(-)
MQHRCGPHRHLHRPSLTPRRRWKQRSLKLEWRTRGPSQRQLVSFPKRRRTKCRIGSRTPIISKPLPHLRLPRLQRSLHQLHPLQTLLRVHLLHRLHLLHPKPLLPRRLRWPRPQLLQKPLLRPKTPALAPRRRSRKFAWLCETTCWSSSSRASSRSCVAQEVRSRSWSRRLIPPHLLPISQRRARLKSMTWTISATCSRGS